VRNTHEEYSYGASTWLINRRHHIPSITAASGGNGKDARRTLINGRLTRAPIPNTEKIKISMLLDVQSVPSGKLWYVINRSGGVPIIVTMISANVPRIGAVKGSFERTMTAAIASKRT
jgi:hypothetical protein